MRLLYNAGIAVYYLLLRAAALYSPKARAWHYGRKGLFEKLDAIFTAHHANEQPAPIAWFHCASLGEFEQGRPVIEAFRQMHPGHLILLTFFSPSGYNHKKDYKGADHVFYLPLDTRRNARKFITIIKPQYAVFVKYEFWFNYLNELFKKQIPVFTISAIFRPDQHFFKWYGGWFRTHLRKINRIFVQDTESAELLNMVEIDNVTVSGDTRFDRVFQIKNQPRDLPLIAQFAAGKTVIAGGSTWPPDDELLISLQTVTGDSVKFIIVPHEINTTYIKSLADKCKGRAVLLSEAENADLHAAEFLIIDTIGLLSQLYRYAHIAYIGGGFGVGIHNTLEAAAYGIPVFFGPNYQRFREAREMTEQGVAFSVENKEQLIGKVTEFLNNQELLQTVSDKAGNYVATRTGATAIILQEISRFVGQ